MAITVQLQTESVVGNGPTITLPVALGAGVNRRVLVCALSDCFSNPEAGIPTGPVTYGGIAMSLVTDGVNVAQAVRSALNFPSGTNIAALWYELREAQLPPNGAQNVVVPFTGTGSGLWSMMVGAWVLEGCAQDVNVRSVANATANASLSTAIGAILAQGETTDAIFMCGVNDTITGTITPTIGQLAPVTDFELAIGSTARGVGASDLAAPSFGPVGCAMTYTVAATGRTALSAIRLAQPLVAVGGSVALELVT